MSNYTLWWFIQPSHALLFLAAVGLLLSRRRAGRWIVAGALTALVVCAFGPIASWLARPLEERFPVPGSAAPPPYGIIVLAGAEQPLLFDQRGSPHLNGAGERLTTFLWLAATHEQARLIHSGTGPMQGHHTQSTTARALLDPLLPGREITYDDRSRNTFRSAQEVRQLLSDTERSRDWWLVTSAIHQPRAVASFRAEGINVTAWPTDYFTAKRPGLHLLAANTNLTMLDWAAHEWVGLLYYRLLGRTQELFPAASPASDTTAEGGGEPA
jgi:uncharacterized SAM-binding protein YcdF (DUF218 family)